MRSSYGRRSGSLLGAVLVAAAAALGGCAGAPPVAAATPAALPEELTFRNLSGVTVRVYLVEGGAARLLGRVGGMSAAALPLPRDLALEERRELRLSVVPTGPANLPGRTGPLQEVIATLHLPLSQLPATELALSGSMLYSIPTASASAGAPSR